jgi:hypothetical protein
MMNDRELLEQAAKAVGYPISEGHFESATAANGWWGWIYIDGDGEPPTDSAWVELWNPLTDDGDALRLAVKLKLNVINGAHSPGGIAFVYAQSRGLAPSQEYGMDDPHAATRRAIVRAAAEIGKSMP